MKFQLRFKLCMRSVYEFGATMIKIEEYILLSLSDRQAHLKLNEDCVERETSTKYNGNEYRGLLAHILNTTIPTGMQIHACHACSNSKCGNPNHLYWGTVKENKADADRVCKGPVTVWDRTVAKYGLEEARARTSKNAVSANTQRGKEIREKIAETVRLRHKQGYYKKDRMVG